jgi:hypothetical protein
MSGVDGRRRPRVTSILVAAVVSAWASHAAAFELKQTKSGAPVHWATGQVTFTVDPTVSAHVKHGADAVAHATDAWSGVSGAPVLTTSVGPKGGKVAVDDVNTVLVAPEGFDAVGPALAITVLSYDSATGNIVDADVVINNDYRFAVLSANATPARGAQALSNESSSTSSWQVSRTSPFDLQHVVAHEIGHGLGLGDTQSDVTALMYAYSTPGNPLPRVPTSDDTAGVEQLYPATAATAGVTGCGQSNVAGSRPRATDALASLALFVAAGAWLASRRRARVLVPIGAALVAVLGAPAPARSAGAGVERLSDARAHVVGVASRVAASGVIETTLELAPSSCRVLSCPARARAHAWGGTVGGITQQVGEHPVAGVGDQVDVVFTGASVEADVAEAVMLGARATLRPQIPTP